MPAQIAGGRKNLIRQLSEKKKTTTTRRMGNHERAKVAVYREFFLASTVLWHVAVVAVVAAVWRVACGQVEPKDIVKCALCMSFQG